MANQIFKNSIRSFSSDLKIRFNLKGAKEEVEDFTKIEIMRKLEFNYLHNLPYDVQGTHAVPKLHERQLVEMFLDHKMIDEEFLTDKFHSMTQDLYSAISKTDYDWVNTLTEKRFGKKIQENCDDYKNKGISLKFTPHEIPHVERPLDQQSYIFDKIFEKGVFFDRSKNDNNYDYFLDTESELEGIRYYQHKYFAGYETEYYLNKYSNKEQDKLSKYRFKYYAEERNRSIVLRVYGVIRDVGRFSSSANNNPYGRNYTGNHMVVFENQLKEPPVIALTNPNLETWIKKHKINHSNWKVTDIDNYMSGKNIYSFKF